MIDDAAEIEATEALAAFAVSFDGGTISDAARGQSKNLLLDALACAIAGHAGDETPQIAAFASALAPGADTSVIGGAHSSLIGATMLNAYLITAVTMCDVHRATLTHVTPEVVPPALAIAERDDLSGQALLEALAIGFEVTTRIGIGLDFPTFRARGFHGPGIIGPFGAAAAVGRLLGFNSLTMARAFGLAGSQAAGTFAAWGTPTVKFHQCRGALSGLMAALLAQQGFVANTDFLTCPDGGLLSAYSGGGHPLRITSDLGIRWELEQIALRPWPAAAAIQGMISALSDLLSQATFKADDVQQVIVRLSPPAFAMHGGFATYTGKFEAMLSAHYVASAVLNDRELSLRQFEPERYDAPELAKFAAEKVLVVENPILIGPDATVEVRLKSEMLYIMRAHDPIGSPGRPMTTDQLQTKFRTYTQPRLSEPRIEGVIHAVANLEELGSVRELMDLLRASR